MNEIQNDATNKEKLDLSEIIELAAKLKELDERIAYREKMLKEDKDKRDRIACGDLPDAMEALQIKSLVLDDGGKLDIKTIIKASLPTKKAIERARTEDERLNLETRLMDGLDWLERHGAGSLIKNLLVVDIGKGEETEAQLKELTELANRLGLPSSADKSVHPQTLTSYVKEKLESGSDIPFEVFGIFTGRKAVIK